MLEEKDRLDFLACLGQEFCIIMEPLVQDQDGLCPQLAYEVFSAVLGKDFSDDSLRSVSETQVEEMSARSRSLLECPAVSRDHLRAVIQHTLARW